MNYLLSGARRTWPSASRIAVAYSGSKFLPDGELPSTVGSSTLCLEHPRLQKTHQVFEVLEVFEGVQLSRLVFC